MKCSNCNTEIEDWRVECPKCKINIEKYNEGERKVAKTTNADCLNLMATINIVLSIIGAITVWANYGMTKYSDFNWIGIASGIGILIAGFTVFFLLKTVVDIHDKI